MKQPNQSPNYSLIVDLIAQRPYQGRYSIGVEEQDKRGRSRVDAPTLNTQRASANNPYPIFYKPHRPDYTLLAPNRCARLRPRVAGESTRRVAGSGYRANDKNSMPSIERVSARSEAEDI